MSSSRHPNSSYARKRDYSHVSNEYHQHRQANSNKYHRTNYSDRSHYNRSRASNERYEQSEDRAPKIPKETAFVQTTLIPIYYQRDTQNTLISRGTDRLKELCDKFDFELVQRTLRSRENLIEEVKIPDYRQLMQTKKFSKFSKCTCDHSKTTIDCSKHKKKSKKSPKKIVKDSDSSSSSSSSDESSSSDSSSDNENVELDGHDDIRSMEINRKRNHPQHLHPDLTFNEPNQTNEGPLCKCKLKNTTFGTRHQIYYGEEMIVKCDNESSNGTRLYHYRMIVEPFKNFVTKHPTFIRFDNNDYIFEGFSLFSHELLPEVPDCVVVIYNHEYKINIVREAMIENFTIRELELIKKYLFREILELYDMKWKGYGLDEGCNRFHILPRFIRPLPYNGKEILSPCEILKYFLAKNTPIVDVKLKSNINSMSDRDWQYFIEKIQGTLVTNPAKRPTTIRLDQLDRDNLKDGKYPLIIHFNMFRNSWLPMIKNDLMLKKVYHKYFKLRHLLNNKPKLSEDDKAKFRKISEEMQSILKKNSEVQKEVMLEINSEGFYCTGIKTDLVQHAVFVPTFVEHLRFHMSIKHLEVRIGYKFKNRLPLQYALTHPSGAFLLHQNLGSNPDHVRNMLYNCRPRNTNYGNLTPHKRKSILRKKGIHVLFSIMSHKAHDTEELSCVSNYERLEFLGDKILELLISKHLFYLFPMFDEGQLSEYRNCIVQNQYLAVLARKLDLQYFIIFYHGVDLCSNSALNHALANSFEALLASIFLDSNLDQVSQILTRILWDDDELQSIWHNIPPHPIQAQLPHGDRHLIESTMLLQQVQKFEQSIGIEFNHIRLLAQAFCTRSASFNLITLGDNQRLEFLGDTVLNFVVSNYLYRYFPMHHEGHLSLLRSSLVCNSTQALLYDELGMGQFILSYTQNSKPDNNGNLKRKADVFEAFIGALYIDQGLEAVEIFCNVCMFNKLQDIIMYQFWNDPKSRLQQCCLSLRDVDESNPSLPTYKLIEERGPPNRKQYRVAVYFNRTRVGEGIGKSIHEGEVEAAKNALKTQSHMFPILKKYVSHDQTNNAVQPCNDKIIQNIQKELEDGECSTSSESGDEKSFKKKDFKN